MYNQKIRVNRSVDLWNTSQWLVFSLHIFVIFFGQYDCAYSNRQWMKIKANKRQLKAGKKVKWNSRWCLLIWTKIVLGSLRKTFSIPHKKKDSVYVCVCTIERKRNWWWGSVRVQIYFPRDEAKSTRRELAEWREWVRVHEWRVRVCVYGFPKPVMVLTDDFDREPDRLMPRIV